MELFQAEGPAGIAGAQKAKGLPINFSSSGSMGRYFVTELGATGGSDPKEPSCAINPDYNGKERANMPEKVPFFSDNASEYDMKRKVYSLGYSMTKSLQFERIPDPKLKPKDQPLNWVFEPTDYERRAREAKAKRERIRNERQ